MLKERCEQKQTKSNQVSLIVEKNLEQSQKDLIDVLEREKNLVQKLTLLHNQHQDLHEKHKQLKFAHDQMDLESRKISATKELSTKYQVQNDFKPNTNDLQTELELEIENLNGKIGVLTHEIANLKSINESSRRAEIETRSLNLQHESTIQLLRTKYDDISGKHKILEEMYDRLVSHDKTHDYAKYQVEIGDLKKNCADWKQRHDSILALHEQKMKETAIYAQTSKNTLIEENQAIVRENLQMKTQVQNLNDKIDALQKKLANLQNVQNDNARLGEQLKDLKRALDENATLREKSDRLETMRHSNDELTKKILELSEQKKELVIEIDSLKKAHAKEIDGLSIIKAELESRILKLEYALNKEQTEKSEVVKQLIELLSIGVAKGEFSSRLQELVKIHGNEEALNSTIKISAERNLKESPSFEPNRAFSFAEVPGKLSHQDENPDLMATLPSRPLRVNLAQEHRADSGSLIRQSRGYSSGKIVEYQAEEPHKVFQSFAKVAPVRESVRISRGCSSHSRVATATKGQCDRFNCFCTNKYEKYFHRNTQGTFDGFKTSSLFYHNH